MIPPTACLCYWLRRDLGTDVHSGLHDKLDPEKGGNTVVSCEHCGQSICGRVVPAPKYKVRATWRHGQAYFGTFTVHDRVYDREPMSV